MYRLSGPKTVFYISIVALGIIIALITPNYFGSIRTLSLSALLIGEAGLSFIPVLALYPKANFTQAILLAVIYFSTTLLICFSTWGINSLGFSSNYAFMVKDDEFYVNTYVLFATNLISLVALIINFHLVYDEELTKRTREKFKSEGYKKRFRFPGISIQKPLLKRPVFEEIKKTDTPSKQDRGNDFEEDFWRPFDFEPEAEIQVEKLPEESSGKLFHQELPKEKEESAFFDTEDPTSPFLERTKVTTQASPFPPQDIKQDLQLIFEQYSSLNAVKKLTSGTGATSKISSTRKEQIKKGKKPYTLPKEEVSVQVEEDIHEASFRQITEQEKLEEIKEKLKKELEEEIKAKLPEIPKEEQTENITESIKNIKEEIIESLKEEIKKELETKEEFVEEEIDETLHEKLINLNKDPQAIGAMLISHKGKLLLEDWVKNQNINEGGRDVINHVSTTARLFNAFNRQINKTNQGNLLHLLLESENGTLALAYVDDKILAVSTKGTGEVYSGQLLRTLSELEEEENP